MLDSGAGRLLASKEDPTRATNLCTFQAKIGTCSEGESLLTESKGNLDLGINPETTLTPPVVFAKGLAHNVIGTSALDLNHGISTFFHGGKATLYRTNGVEIPPSWTALTSNAYDDSGLPFIRRVSAG